MFKKIRSLKIPYNKQGLIYFTCLDYINQSEETQQKILNLCFEVGKDSYQALFDTVTTNKSIPKISMEYFMCERTVYYLREKFYNAWDK